MPANIPELPLNVKVIYFQFLRKILHLIYPDGFGQNEKIIPLVVSFHVEILKDSKIR